MEIMVCDFQGQVTKDSAASISFFLGSLTLGEASCHVVRTFTWFQGQSYGKVVRKD